MVNRRLARFLGWGVLICLLCASTAAGGLASPGGESDPWINSGPHYLIVTPDELFDGLADFIALKQSQGFQVNTLKLSQTGETRQAIKDAIEEEYYSANRPDYLLLVGDEILIPAWPCRSAVDHCKTMDDSLFATDLHYATMDGPGDFIADILYGRFPVSDSIQLSAVVDKYLDYALLTGNEDWLNKAAFLATDDQAHWSTAEASHEYVINNHTLPAGYTGSFPNQPQPGGDKLYAYTYEAGQADVVAAINEGRALVVYAGHGTPTAWVAPAYGQTQVRAMSVPPVSLVASFSGYTASFNEAESFAETWLLAPDTGALAYLGAAHETFSLEDDVFERAFFEALFSGSQDPSLGAAIQSGFAAVDIYRGNNPLKDYYREVYQLLGDPSLNLRLPSDFSLQIDPAQVAVCVPAETEVTVSVQELRSVGLAVELGLLNAPTGIVGILDPTQVFPSAVSNLDLTISDQTAAGDYPLRVTGSNGSSNIQADLLLLVRTNIPAVPLPLIPGNTAREVTLRPHFQWSEAAGATTYDLQIATDIEFLDLTADLHGLTQAEYTLEEDLQPGLRYYWRVRAVNPCGAGTYSPPSRFTTQPMPGECPQDAQPVVYHSTGFESGLDGWSSSGQGNSWTRQSSYANTGQYGVYGQAHAQISDQWLISPLITLPAPAPPLLTFSAWMKYDFEPACFDGGRVEISADDGQTWAPIPESALLTPAYDGTIAVSEGSPLAGQRAWCGQRDWARMVLDFDDYAGQAIRLRYRLATDAQNSAWGWAVDDINLQSCTDLPDYAVQLLPSQSTQNVPAGDQVVFYLSLTNTGLLPASFSLQSTGSDWDVHIMPDLISLAAGESTPINVLVNIPPDAAPGQEQTITVIAASQEDASVWSASQLTVTVRRYGVLLETGSSQSSGFPGTSIPFEITISNTGNAADTFDFSAQSPSGWAVSLPASHALAAGEVRLIPVTIHIPPGALDGHIVKLTLSAESRASPQASDDLSLSITVNWHRVFLPLALR